MRNRDCSRPGNTTTTWVHDMCTYRGTISVSPAGRPVLWLFVRAMSVWYRALLVVCALPLGEVSCRVQGYNTLLMVAVVVTEDPRAYGAAVDVVEASGGDVLGLAACRLFGKVVKDCALAFCDEAAGMHAACGVCGDALTTCGRSRASSAFDLLGGDGHLLGVPDGAFGSDVRRAVMASCIHVVAQSHVEAVDDVATLSGDQPSARRALAAVAVHGLYPPICGG